MYYEYIEVPNDINRKNVELKSIYHAETEIRVVLVFISINIP